MQDIQMPGWCSRAEKGMFTVMKETCKKAMAMALCTVMSFGAVQGAAMGMASAASHYQDGSRAGHHRDLERENTRQEKERKELRERQKKERELREKQRKEEEKRREKERRDEKRRPADSNKKYSQGEMTTAAIAGAALGAVIAKNT